MSQFDDEEIREEENINSEEDNTPPPKPPFKGRHINFTIIYIIAGVIVLYLIISVFRGPSINEKDKTKDSKKEVQKVEANLNAGYGDIDFKEPKYEDTIKDTRNTVYINQGGEQKNQVNQEELERLRKLQEEANKAKRSPIGFKSVRTETNTQTTQGTGSGREEDYDQNRQASKKAFLYGEKRNDFILNSAIIPPLSPYTVTAGDFIPAVVITGMNSDLGAKTIVAQVSENIYDTINHKYLLIPQGTRILGKYDSNVTWGQERLLVVWQRLIFPDGSSLDLDNMQGVDLTGQAGITGKVNNHFATLLKGVLLSSAMGAAGAVVTDNDDNWRNAAAGGAGEQIITIGDKFASKALDRQPTITIKVGDRFNIMVHADMILRPYKSQRAGWQYEKRN